jgi:hypothetical protein
MVGFSIGYDYYINGGVLGGLGYDATSSRSLEHLTQMHFLFFSDKVEGYSTGSGGLIGGGGGGGNTSSNNIGASLVYYKLLLLLGYEKNIYDYSS